MKLNFVNLREPLEKFNCTVLQHGVKKHRENTGLQPFLLAGQKA